MRAEGRTFDYVLWIDAGSMREKHGYAQWPDAARLEALWTDGSRVTGTDRDDLILIPLERNIPERFADWQEEDGPLDALHDLNNSEGAVFAGRVALWLTVIAPLRLVVWWQPSRAGMVP